MTEIYSKALQFANDYLQSRAVEIDENREFPIDIFKKLGEEGFLSLLIPKEHGGLGKGVLEHVEACLAFAQTVPSVSLCYMMHNNGIPIFYRTSTEIAGKIFKQINEEHALFAAATSEPKSGNNTTSSETTFEVLEDKIILNGKKIFVTMGGHANYYKVTARDVKDNRQAWILVPLDAKGVSFDKNSWNGLGMKGNVSCNLYLENVELPLYSILAYEDTVDPTDYMVTENVFMLGLASTYAGIALGVCRDAIDHVKTRVYPDGSKLADFETIQMHLSKIYSNALAAKELCLSAARAVDELDKESDLKCSIARIFATEAAMSATYIGMRLGGGQAYNGVGPMSRWLRDSYAGQVMIPSVDKLNLWVGKHLASEEFDTNNL